MFAFHNFIDMILGNMIIMLGLVFLAILAIINQIPAMFYYPTCWQQIKSKFK
ncbi:hypothetical protein FC98_GL000956 [Lentilactobacillus kisonensis DSM 19906 = JCM 15041]|nr:hypothetical protein FC98_GL000956 [Lentilactobacillus kisonensis DSM 19906 = JCM 15041]